MTDIPDEAALTHHDGLEPWTGDEKPLLPEGAFAAARQVTTTPAKAAQTTEEPRTAEDRPHLTITTTTGITATHEQAQTRLLYIKSGIYMLIGEYICTTYVYICKVFFTFQSSTATG